MPKRSIVTLADGSQTIFSPEYGETYHSNAGSVLESEHVFITNGLERWKAAHSLSDSDNLSEIHILEYGFGTGLNAFLTLIALRKWEIAENLHPTIRYHSVEKYPLSEDEYTLLQYEQYCEEQCIPKGSFLSLHEAPWEVETKLCEGFLLEKRQCDFLDYRPDFEVDIVYYDAFSPSVQPQLWSQEQFERIVQKMRSGALLVTYSSKGTVKQALRNLSLEVHRLPGAGGKRHMVVAEKA